MDRNATGNNQKRKLSAKLSLYLKQHTLFVPIILAFFCFIIVAILSITIWFSTSLKSALEETVYETAEHETEMAADILRFALEDFDDMSGQLGIITTISPSAYQNSKYYAYKALDSFNSSSYKYDNLLFYYPSEKTMLSVRGTAQLPIFFSDVARTDELRDYLNRITTSTLFSTAHFGAPLFQSRLVLAYPLVNKTLAMFLLENATLHEMLTPTDGMGNSLRFIVDQEGCFLWSSQAVNESTLSAIREQLKNTDPHSQLRLETQRYLCSKAKLTNGATFVMLAEVSTRFHTVETSIFVLIVLCMMLLVLGICMLAIGIRRTAAPIITLVDDVYNVMPEEERASHNTIDVLKQVCSQYSALMHESNQKNALMSNEQLRDVFILRLIGGQYTDSDELSNLCRWLDVEFPYPYFVSCLLLFEKQPTDSERISIEEQLRRVTGESYNCCFCLTPDRQSAVGLVNLASDSIDFLRQFGELLLKQLLEHSSVTVSMGHVYGSMDMLGRSYLEAHSAMERKLILGKNICILYGEAPILEDDLQHSIYPQQLLDEYTSCLRHWDAGSIQQKLNEIIEFIHHNNLSLQQVKCICFELTASMLREVSHMGSLTASMDSSLHDVFSIAEYASVSELAQNIIQLSHSVQQYVEARKDRRKSSLILRCQQVIQENVSNAQFSLELLAEQFEITPQTLRRNFKEVTGQTMSSYLIGLRIKLAKQLLTETDLELSSICIQCGYIDVSSFVKLFKSDVGMSPGNYRELYRKS